MIFEFLEGIVRLLEAVIGFVFEGVYVAILLAVFLLAAYFMLRRK